MFCDKRVKKVAIFEPTFVALEVNLCCCCENDGDGGDEGEDQDRVALRLQPRGYVGRLLVNNNTNDFKFLRVDRSEYHFHKHT